MGGGPEPQPQAPAQPPPPQVAQQQGIAGADTQLGLKRGKELPAKAKQAARSKTKMALGQYQEALQAQVAQPKPAEARAGQPPASQPAMPSGLASLDVDIPQVGMLYRFTSPRGEATITVRAVSRSFTGTLERLGLAALIAVAVWVIYKAVPLLVAPERTLGLVLVVAGVVSLLAGILPGAGLVLIVAGLIIRRRRRIVRGRPASG